jgi:hypothetical protein
MSDSDSTTISCGNGNMSDPRSEHDSNESLDPRHFDQTTTSPNPSATQSNSGTGDETESDTDRTVSNFESFLDPCLFEQIPSPARSSQSTITAGEETESNNTDHNVNNSDRVLDLRCFDRSTPTPTSWITQNNPATGEETEANDTDNDINNFESSASNADSQATGDLNSGASTPSTIRLTPLDVSNFDNTVSNADNHETGDLNSGASTPSTIRLAPLDVNNFDNSIPNADNYAAGDLNSGASTYSTIRSTPFRVNNFDNSVFNADNHATGDLNSGASTIRGPSFHSNEFDFASSGFEWELINPPNAINPRVSGGILSNPYNYTYPLTNDQFINNEALLCDDTVNSSYSLEANTAFDNYSDNQDSLAPFNPSYQNPVNPSHFRLTTLRYYVVDGKIVYADMIPPIRSTRGALPARFSSNIEGYSFTDPEHHHQNRPQAIRRRGLLQQGPPLHGHSQPHMSNYVYGASFNNPYLPHYQQIVGNYGYPTNVQPLQDPTLAGSTQDEDFTSFVNYEDGAVTSNEQQPQELPDGGELHGSPAPPGRPESIVDQGSLLGGGQAQQTSVPGASRSPPEATLNASELRGSVPGSAAQNPAGLQDLNESSNAGSLVLGSIEELCTQDADGNWVAPDPKEMTEERAELLYLMEMAESHQQERGMAPEEWTRGQLWPGEE